MHLKVALLRLFLQFYFIRKQPYNNSCRWILEKYTIHSNELETKGAKDCLCWRIQIVTDKSGCCHCEMEMIYKVWHHNDRAHSPWLHSISNAIPVYNTAVVFTYLYSPRWMEDLRVPEIYKSQDPLSLIHI